MHHYILSLCYFLQEYISSHVRPHVLFDYGGRAPDAFSAFLTELIHLNQTKLHRHVESYSRTYFL